MNIHEQLKENLKYLRVQKGHTMERLAEVCKVSRQAYSAYEKGQSVMSIETLHAIAQFYNVTMDLLVNSSLYDGRQPILNFVSYSLNEGGLKMDDKFIQIRNYNYGTQVVKIDDLNFKIFETTTTLIPELEHIFEYDNKLRMGYVYLNSDGTGLILEDGKPTFITKDKAKTLVIIAVISANIKKEIQIESFL